jgi:Cu+-exporting ATPase
MDLERNPAWRGDDDDAGERAAARDMMRRFLWGAALAMPVLLLAMGGMVPLARDLVARVPPQAGAWIQMILSAPVVFWSGAPLLQRAWVSLRTRSLNMFSLIGLGVLSSWGFSAVAVLFPHLIPHALRHHGLPVYFESAAVITVLVLLGQILEGRARAATGSAVKSLLALAPRTAFVLKDGAEIETPLGQIQPGDLIRVKPGASIPVDGIVTEGASSVTEAMITGEPMPASKEKGARVVAGTVNGTGSFIMRAEKVGSDTLLARIVQMVADAQRTRAPIQQLADRVAAWFVPAVVLVAALAFAAWFFLGPEPRLHFAIANAVAVLIIACPCALGLATPVAVTVAIGRGAQMGVLVREARAFEALEKAHVLMLDKTGTLTEGRPALGEARPLPGHNARDLIALAAAAESPSEHPIALAIVRAAQERRIPVPPASDFQAIVGGGVLATVQGQEIFVGQPACLQKHGIQLDAELHATLDQWQSQGHTVVIVMADGRPLGLLSITDRIKDGAAAAVQAFRSLGLRIEMLTGDTEPTARHIAEKLGIDTIAARISPEEKLERVRAAKQSGAGVIMAGDGINDAPALAAADAGIAMGSGTDIAMESAGITLVKGDLRGIHHAIVLSRATMRTIRANLWLAFLYNGLGIPIAAGTLYPFTGLLLNPMIASAAMSLSSLCVILNSLRLRRQP